jgi:hypothetical protein
MKIINACKESALFTYLVRWYPGAVNLPPGDIILAQLAYPLSDVIFCLGQEQLTYLSTNIENNYL